MEWRLFLPISPYQPTHHELQQVIDEIDRLFLRYLSNQEAEESRQDAYFVTSHEFGVKFRHGKKLELKVKSKNPLRFGIEEWRKSKLGKTEIESQVESILNHLSESGYSEEREKFRSIILRKQVVEVTKSRKNTFVDGVMVEYCSLVVRGGERWLSIAVEGSTADEIALFLITHDLMHHFFSLISRFIHHSSPLEGEDISRKHVVVCGYPFWVQYIDGNYTTDELGAAIAPLREIFISKGLDTSLL